MLTFFAIIGILAIIIVFSNMWKGTDPAKEQAFIDAALSKYDSHNFHEAIRILNEAIIYNPFNYQLWNNRGLAKLQLG